uniref:Uncharacterized protein n=1 Tax=Picea glauca TaxID=3330 RepID=A0A117NHQ9_PICGL|nr:hypothetical protein ABT39_MTgene4107 [Picea glauca]QHR92554.1 hypothetical protein Q903MT_gene6600 [Picea sitchensis]
MGPIESTELARRCLQKIKELDGLAYLDNDKIKTIWKQQPPFLLFKMRVKENLYVINLIGCRPLIEGEGDGYSILLFLPGP